MTKAKPNVAARPRGNHRTYRWIRQLHLWIGAWGAIAAIVYGYTGLVMNHRMGDNAWPQGDSVEAGRVVLDVPAAARASAEDLSKWLLLTAILLFVVVLGFFLPPVSIILMTAPIILPPLKAAGFDLIWFGVVMTIVMEMGLIHPPVGLNIFVIKNIAPDIPLNQIMWGTLPFVLLITLAVVIVCLFPGLVTWLPAAIMG